MASSEPPEKKVEVSGAIITQEGFLAVPYNHWKHDISWVVSVISPGYSVSYIRVEALTAEDACLCAIEKFKETDNSH